MRAPALIANWPGRAVRTNSRESARRARTGTIFVRTKIVPALLLALLVALAGPAWAVRPDEALTDPALEARARALSAELRCMVCQNQSIDDSDAPLAHDLRLLVRERLAAGDTDSQVLDFLVARYGEFVLLKPRFSPHTAVLWIAPLAALLLGAALAAAAWRRARAAPAAPRPLSEDEERAVRELLDRG
jgi:cytochrome c-type biogenesis protein CcmH